MVYKAAAETYGVSRRTDEYQTAALSKVRGALLRARQLTCKPEATMAESSCPLSGEESRVPGRHWESLWIVRHDRGI